LYAITLIFPATTIPGVLPEQGFNVTTLLLCQLQIKPKGALAAEEVVAAPTTTTTTTMLTRGGRRHHGGYGAEKIKGWCI